MLNWRRPRTTNPLPQEAPASEAAPEHEAGSETLERPSDPTETTPTAHVNQPEPGQPAQGPGRPGPSVSMAGRPLAPDDPELMRIREILVGPYLRDHERRLRAVEQAQSAGQPKAEDPPADWRAQIDEAIERMRQLGKDQNQAHAAAVAQLTAELTRSREERSELLQALDALRTELARERLARENLAAVHARAIEELARRLDEEREAHLRLHARLATELDARLERERQVHAESLRQAQDAQAEQMRPPDEPPSIPGEPSPHAAALVQLVDEAEHALAAMQAERQYLAGLLAELGLHLVRHAASPAAARAEEAAQHLSDSSVRLRAEPGS